MNKVIQLTPDQQMIQVAQQFLQRCDLKGGEVDAYAKAFNFLQAIVDNEIMIIPTEVWNKVNAQVKELQTKLEEFEDLQLRMMKVEDDEVVEIVGFDKPTLGDEEAIEGEDPVVELEAVESEDSEEL